jgi:hypothetical protein
MGIIVTITLKATMPRVTINSEIPISIQWGKYLSADGK